MMIRTSKGNNNVAAGCTRRALTVATVTLSAFTACGTPSQTDYAKAWNQSCVELKSAAQGQTSGSVTQSANAQALITQYSDSIQKVEKRLKSVGVPDELKSEHSNSLTQIEKLSKTLQQIKDLQLNFTPEKRSQMVSLLRSLKEQTSTLSHLKMPIEIERLAPSCSNLAIGN